MNTSRETLRPGFVQSPCVDDEHYLDEQSLSCLEWKTADCTTAETEWGYSVEGQAHLIAACPLSCGHERCQLVTFSEDAVASGTTCGTQGCNVCAAAQSLLCVSLYDTAPQGQCEQLSVALCGPQSNAGALSNCIRAPRCTEITVADPIVVGEGCFAEGELGDTCILTCASGYTPSDVGVGVCELSSNQRVAAYIGQTIECRPETEEDGVTLSAAYCQRMAPEIIADHCCMGFTGDQFHSSSECNGISRFPQECSVDCADRWLPLWDQCAAHLGEMQSLTTLCETTAEDFLSLAPTSIVISGMCPQNSNANGEYVLDDRTIASRRAWSKQDTSLGEFHLFFADDESEAANRWCFADSLTEGQCFATYDGTDEVPPWHANEWLSSCDSGGQWRTTLDLVSRALLV